MLMSSCSCLLLFSAVIHFESVIFNTYKEAQLSVNSRASTEQSRLSIVLEMDATTILEPGFGWATSKKRLVTLDDNGRFVTESDMKEGFPSSFPCDFVREFCAKRSIPFHFTNEEFSATLREVLTSYLSLNHILHEYDEFCTTGKSNGRAMKWDIMTISPNTSFKLHAHPNIEIIYVIQGAIHEYRYEV